jgi:hypothetical protein
MPRPSVIAPDRTATGFTIGAPVAFRESPDDAPVCGVILAPAVSTAPGEWVAIVRPSPPCGIGFYTDLTCWGVSIVPLACLTLTPAAPLPETIAFR